MRNQPKKQQLAKQAAHNEYGERYDTRKCVSESTPHRCHGHDIA
jgi:hypothetical protein